MADTADAPKTEKKGLPVLAVVGLGCLGLLVLSGIGLTIAGKVLFSKFGANLAKTAIEQKTGISVNTDDNGQTGITIKDKESGQEINVGEAKIPADFPKDFPLYPGAKPAGTLSGMGKSQSSKGFWLVMSTADDATKVSDYYSKNLPTSGWTIEQSMDLGGVTSISAKKGTNVSTVTVSADKEKKETSIMITIAPSEVTPTESE